MDNDESLQTIREVYESHEYLLDPHTSVAWKVAERLREENPVLIVSTAHWAKFGADVYRALTGIAAGEPLPAEVAELSGFELNAMIARDYKAGKIPTPLAELQSLPVRFSEVCAGSTEGVEAAVKSWLER